MPRRLLVTGGAGFIGANFVHYWLARHPGDRVVVLDALTYAGHRQSLESAERLPGFRFVQGNVCDAELVQSLLQGEQLDTIVHFAAESHVDRSIENSDAFIETNVVGTHALLKAACRAWGAGAVREAGRFHHVSTDEVYGSLRTEDPPATEATPYAPNSPYAASKAAADHIVRAFHRTYGLPVTVTTCSNNYGPYQFPEKLIPLMIINALEGRALPVYGRGENVRDWLHVGDHCRAIDAVLARGRVGERYNVAGRNAWRNLDIVRHLCQLLGRRFAQSADLRARFPGSPAARGAPLEELIRFVPDRAGHDWRYAVDDAKLEREVACTPAESFASGIESTIDWYLANEAWWRGVLSRLPAGAAP
jgi:dTDP-glucose 4,6-dehydratase